MLPKVRFIDPLTVTVPEEFWTARLTLCKPSPSMAMALADARSESYETLLPWFHDDMGTRSDEAEISWQAKRLADQAHDFDRRVTLSYYVLEDEHLLGMVGLLPLWRRGQVKLTYWLRSTAQRKGYGVEAVAAAVVFAGQVLDARLVTTGHAEPNIGSARLARKLGFLQIARQPLACEMPDGTLVAGVSYALEDIEHLNKISVAWE